MGITGERGRKVRHSSSTPPPGRLSKGKELTLFLVMMAVLVALVVYGVRA